MCGCVSCLKFSSIMRSAIILPLIIVWLVSVPSEATNHLNVTAFGEVKISEYARAIIEHYKQKTPMGLPLEIKDPMDIAEIKASIPSVDTIFFKNTKLYGLSKLKVDFIKVNVNRMAAAISISLETLDLFGNYSISNFFSSSNGPFAIKTRKMQAEARTTLEINEMGHLEAQHISMDFRYENIDIKFDNLSMMFGFVQNIFKTMPNLIMDSIKPYVVSEFTSFVRSKIDKEAAKIPINFPNSVSPIDQVLAEIRRGLRARACDPFKISDKYQTVGLLEIRMSNTWITGLTSIHRVGNITFELKEKNLYGNVKIGTDGIKGTSQWEIGFIGGLLPTAGTTTFTIDFIKVDIYLLQSMDTRTKPQLEKLIIDPGNIQVRFDGAGTADYIIELVGNILPNLLRYQITEALEIPITRRIQEHLNMINVEKVVLDTADRIDNGNLKDIVHTTFVTSTCPLSKLYF